MAAWQLSDSSACCSTSRVAAASHTCSRPSYLPQQHGSRRARRAEGVRRRAASSEQEEAMRKAMEDPKMQEQMQQMQEQMQRPEVQAQMQQMQAAMQNEQLQKKVQSLREDPELKSIFEDLEKGGMGAMMKAMNDPQILSKIGAKMGDIDMGSVMAASRPQAGAAANPPPQAPPAAPAAAPEINSLLDAAKAGDLEAVEDFLAIKRDVNERDAANQCTPLHYAVAFDRTEVVSELLSNKADPNLADAKGNTPLHYATGYGRAALVKVLLEAGANGALENAGHQTPLDLALQDERNPVQQDQAALDLLEHAASAGLAD